MTTTTRFRPCLWFDDQAEQAATFYGTVFPNSQITSVSHYGPDMPGPEGAVMYVEFELDGQAISAINGGPQFTFSEAISLEMMCADQDEVDHYRNGLIADGGEPGPCGWLKDQYGLSWQVVPAALSEMMASDDEAAKQRAMRAVLAMSKLEVAAIQRAFDGT